MSNIHSAVLKDEETGQQYMAIYEHGRLDQPIALIRWHDVEVMLGKWIDGTMGGSGDASLSAGLRLFGGLILDGTGTVRIGNRTLLYMDDAGWWEVWEAMSPGSKKTMIHRGADLDLAIEVAKGKDDSSPAE